jgi:hypothetical protein
MVGERQRRHLVLLGLPDQISDPVGAVEQGVLGVGVEVYEAHGRRRGGAEKVKIAF